MDIWDIEIKYSEDIKNKKVPEWLTAEYFRELFGRVKKTREDLVNIKSRVRNNKEDRKLLVADVQDKIDQIEKEEQEKREKENSWLAWAKSMIPSGFKSFIGGFGDKIYQYLKSGDRTSYNKLVQKKIDDARDKEKQAQQELQKLVENNPDLPKEVRQNIAPVPPTQTGRELDKKTDTFTEVGLDLINGKLSLGETYSKLSNLLWEVFKTESPSDFAKGLKRDVLNPLQANLSQIEQNEQKIQKW